MAAWPALAFALAFELLLQQRRAAVTEPMDAQPVDSEGPDRPSGPPLTLAMDEAARIAPVPLPDWSEPAAPAGEVPTEPATERAEQRVPSPDAGEADVGGPGEPVGRDRLEQRTRELLAAAGTRSPGRRALARQLGVSEHQARTVLATVSADLPRDAHPTNGAHGTGGARAGNEEGPR